MPLETLSSELDAYLSVLKNRLLEVINEHYADFVSLSSRLVNVDSDVQRMQRPLMEIKVSMPEHPSVAGLSVLTMTSASLRRPCCQTRSALPSLHLNFWLFQRSEVCTSL